MGRVELKEILHSKVDCSDFGPVRDRDSLPYWPKCGQSQK